MKCEVARNLMSAYIDREINEADRISFEKHLENCPHCREEYELLLEVITDCSNIDEVELPDNFGEELHQKLINEKISMTRRFVEFFTKSKLRAVSGVAAAVLVVALVIGGSQLFNGNTDTLSTGNSAKSAQKGLDRGIVAYSNGNVLLDESDQSVEASNVPITQPTSAGANSYSMTIGNTAEKGKVTAAFSEGDATAPQGEAMSRAANFDRKVIRNGSLSVKLVKLDEKLAQIRKLTEANGGYIESSQVENMGGAQNTQSGNGASGAAIRYAYVVIRIPAENFDGIFDDIKAMGKTLNENITGTDITSQYRDTSIKVENLRVQEARLRELLTKANNVDEILRIENELNRVRTDIDDLSGTLKQWDDQVVMSSISISLTEVTPEELKNVDVPSIWSKAVNGFIGAINNILSGLEKLVVFLISTIPYIAILAILAAIVLFIIKKRKKRKQSK